MPSNLPPIHATINYRDIKRIYGVPKPMTTDINRDFSLIVDGTYLPCTIHYIQDTGRVNLSGPSPDVRKLMNKGKQFTIQRVQDGKVMVSGVVLKAEEITVMDVTVISPGEAETVQNELTLLCLLDKCVWFEAIE